jgi:hypothetical protein
MVMPMPLGQPQQTQLQTLNFSAEASPFSVANPNFQTMSFNPAPNPPPPESFFGPQPKGLSKCAIGSPGILGFGKTCFLTVGQGESLLGGLLIVAGGIVVILGIGFIVASLVAFRGLPAYNRAVSGLASQITQTRRSPETIKQSFKKKAKKGEKTAETKGEKTSKSSEKSSKYVLVPADEAPIAS